MAYEPKFGLELGRENLLERARKGDRQLSWVAQGQGEFTAGLLRELATNCDNNATDRVEPFAHFWEDVVDNEDRSALGVGLAGDILTATDNILRTLARCAGECEGCVFQVERMTLDDAMRINATNVQEQG